MASGSSSRKGKAMTTKKKYHPTPYNALEILLRDPDVHISKFAFNREVSPIPLIHGHAYECKMMLYNVCYECDTHG